MMMNEGQLIVERLERFKIFCGKFQRKHGWVIYLCKKQFILGNVQCLEWILTQYGSNVHEHDDSSKKLQGIHYACQNDNIECLNVLIEHGANINIRSGNRPQFHRKSAQDRSHWLPIEFAIICKSHRCIQRLIEAGSQHWDTTFFAPPDWVVPYIEQRTVLRQAAMIIMMSQRRGALQGQDRHLVRIIAQLVWQLRLYEFKTKMEEEEKKKQKVN